MKAAEARSLKVGDWVRASFAGYVKSCDKAEKRENGTRVEWPFWLERPLQGDLAK